MAAYKPTSVEFHRNGVAGDPFTVIRLAGNNETLAAIAFDDGIGVGGIAVISPTDPEAKWRGDRFAPALRDLLDHYERLRQDGRSAEQALAALGTLSKDDDAANFTYNALASTAGGR